MESNLAKLKELKSELKYKASKITNIKNICEYYFLNESLFQMFEWIVMEELDQLGETKFYSWNQLAWLPDIPPTFLRQCIDYEGSKVEALEKLKKFFSTKQGKNGVPKGGILVKALKKDYTNQNTKTEALAKRSERWSKLVSIKSNNKIN
jgi:hypothetical protein